MEWSSWLAAELEDSLTEASGDFPPEAFTEEPLEIQRLYEGLEIIISSDR